MKKLMLILTIGLSLQANAHRITPESMIRCKVNTNPERCERQRAKAVAIQCVTAEEANELRRLGGMPTCFEEDNSFMGWCPCGCFAADTTIRTNANAASEVEFVQNLITKFANSEKPQVAHLSGSSKLNSIQLKNGTLKNVSYGPEEKPTFIVKTKNSLSKGTIELSANHPVVLSDGTILRAEKLKVGNKLLNQAGQAEEIVSIDTHVYKGLVYNVNVDSDVDSEHIVVANGYLMGDLYLQGSLGYFENQILVRK